MREVGRGLFCKTFFCLSSVFSLIIEKKQKQWKISFLQVQLPFKSMINGI